MEREGGFRSEGKEDKEREDEILKFQIEMARLLKDAKQPPVVNWLENIIQSPHFDTDWAFVVKNLEPDQITPNTGGIHWKIELLLVYKRDHEKPEKAGREISYFLTTNDELVKVELKEDDHLPEPPEIKDEADLLKDMMSERWDEEQREMDENLKLQVKMGLNGQPVPTEEIRWINIALSEAAVGE